MLSRPASIEQLKMENNDPVQELSNKMKSILKCKWPRRQKDHDLMYENVRTGTRVCAGLPVSPEPVEASVWPG